MNESIKIMLKREKTIDSGEVIGIHVSEKISISMLDRIRLIKGINWIFQDNFDLHYLKVNISKMFDFAQVRELIINRILHSYSGVEVIDISNPSIPITYEALGSDEKDASYYAHSEDHKKEEE